MMYNYPFYSFPRFRRYPSYYGPIPPVSSLSSNSHKLIDPSSNENQTKNSRSNKVDHDKINQSKILEKDEDVFFEIFGLKLFYDDILLICLIFFLYQEGVDDQYLFIALVLLLLS